MKNRLSLDNGSVMVIKVIDRLPEVFVVHSSKGGVYRWWEYPATKAGYKDAVSTASLVSQGLTFPPPIEERAYGD